MIHTTQIRINGEVDFATLKNGKWFYATAEKGLMQAEKYMKIHQKLTARQLKAYALDPRWPTGHWNRWLRMEG
tara:strand:- start:1352 stop:1570 length:219 start_codon:yes stop_codon:yes gene_type:complete